MLKQIFIPISPTLSLKGTIKDKTNYLIKSYLLLLLLLIGLGIFLKAYDLLLVNFFHIPSIIKSNKVNADLTMTYGKGFGLLIIALGGPFLEELIFRLPLNFNSSSIAITVAVISYRLMMDHIFKFNPDNLSSYLKVLGAIMIFLVFKTVLDRQKPLLTRED